MRALWIALACALAPVAAFADEPAPVAPATSPAATEAAAAPVSEFSVPTETLTITGARPRMFESGAAAGGYSFGGRTYAGGTSRVFTEVRGGFTYAYHFERGEQQLFTGKCRLRTEGHSMFGIAWDQRTTQAYKCEFEGIPIEQRDFEVALPAFRETRMSFGGFSMTAGADNDPEKQAILKARMLYDGVTYEARPTGFGREQPFSRRVVTGYTISRDGAPVGRITFGTRPNARGDIIAPVAEADGREPVLFMALSLLQMPDVYVESVREELMRGPS